MFGVLAFILLGGIYSACGSFASSANYGAGRIIFSDAFSNSLGNKNTDSLFFSQNGKTSLETPDLKIVQGNTISGISAPSVVSAKVLGDVFGGGQGTKKDIIDYIVQPGDTFQSIAESNGISVNTLLWANELSLSSVIKTGQTLTILPADGILHVVKLGDTVGAIALKYKAGLDDVIAFNSLASQDDIYIGDIVIVPGGVMPKKSAVPLDIQVPLADNYFIFPVQGKITQGLHFYNAVDVANKCGTPIYAAAAGTVQRVKYGYNFGGGNLLTILHSNGTVTYYGHLSTIFVKPGDRVDVGQNIALVGGGTGAIGDGLSTGCHVHFQVTGAKNPLAKYPIGTNISYK